MSAAIRWFAERLRRFADWIDRPGAAKATHWTFTFELGEGIRFREDGRGCRVWYFGDEDYDRAHDEADEPSARIDWKTMTVTHPRPSTYREERS